MPRKQQSWDFAETRKVAHNGKRKPFKRHCRRCNGSTWHNVVHSYEIILDGRSMEKTYIDHQILECKGCNSVSFRLVEIIPDIDSVYEHTYPKPELRDQLNIAYLPPKVKTIYKETHESINHQTQPLLTGSGIRTIVEMVCKHKRAKGYNLKAKIDDLVVKGVLSQESASILHRLRSFGNSSVHDCDPQDDWTLNAAMDVVEHLLDAVYIIPKTAKRIKKR